MSDAAGAAGTAGSPATPAQAQTSDAAAGSAKPAAGGADQSTKTTTATKTAAKPDAKTSAAAVPTFKGTKHKVPLDGGETEVDYDELVRGYSHNSAANKRMQEAADVRKQAEAERKQADAERAVLKAVETGDWRPLIEKVGVDRAHDFAVDFLNQYIEYQELSPEQKRARELEHENRQLKAAEDKRKAEEKKAADARLDQEVGQELDTEIKAAIETAGRKPTPRLLFRITEDMVAKLEADGPGRRLSAAEALERAAKSLDQDVDEGLSQMSPEDLVKRLPKQTLAALRKIFADEVLGQDPFGSAGQTGNDLPPPPRRAPKRKVVGTDNYFDHLETKFGGK